MSRSTVLRFALVCVLLTTLLLVAQAATAQSATPQPTKPQCDIDAVIKHQNEHAQELAHFADDAKTNLNAALATLYRTSIAYQALAIECGFTDGVAVEAAHELEHSGLFDDASHSDAHVHTEEEEAATLALARTIGDPDQGKILFNTVRPEVLFACATCHRVDSTETLVGPGLLGISGHHHNHAAAESTPDAMAGMAMGATATPDAMAGMAMGATATPDTMAGMDMSGTAAPEMTLAEKVEFLRTSITNPSATVMTGFPDNLMPKIYGTIFTEAEINNLIAYLMTLD